ncbi:MAG: DUF11 domain-containing protein [Eubacteriales bacterium]|nr:DUF11 domain-containing protein [Eubacteriales bacterium]
MKKNSWKILLSVLLMVTMVVGMLPCAAFAEELNGTQEQQTVNENEEKTGAEGEPGQDSVTPDGEELLDLDSVEAQAASKFALNLDVTSYGAPFLDGSGNHTQTKWSTTIYIERSKVGSNNASGSATGRFVGSNETGWTLYIDIVAGDYSETIQTKCRVTNKDMSKATGNITFGVYFSGNDPSIHTTLHINGGADLPVQKLETKIVYDANGGVNPPAAESKQVEKGKTGSFTVKGQENMTNGDLIFKGWNTVANGSGKSYSKGDSAVVDAGKTLILYAQWDNGQTPPPAPTPNLGQLGITKTASVSSVKPGDKFSYTITVTNNTGVDLTDVVVSDVLPAGITYVDSTVPAGVSFTGSAEAPAWKIASIKNGETVTFSVNVAVAENAVPGKVTNTAKITHIVAGTYEYGEGSLPSDTADVEIKSGDEKVSMSGKLTVKFVGLDSADFPAGYKVSGAERNEFFKGDISPLTKDETAMTYTYSTTIEAVPGKEYTLSFAQTGFAVDGYSCDATENVEVKATADKETGLEATITINYTKNAKVKVPTRVIVEFAGLDPADPLPSGYALTGADTNEFLKGAIDLGDEEAAAGHRYRTYDTTVEAVLGQSYTLKFSQSGFNVPGYNCDAKAEVSGDYSAELDRGDIGAIEVRIKLTYTKQNLITYPGMSVRIYFKGIDSLPEGFAYTLTGADTNPTDPFRGGPLKLSSGVDSGIPYLQFDGGETKLEAGKEYTLSFTQANYNIDGYTCVLGVTEFKFTPEVATDTVKPVMFTATNVYTKDGAGEPDWDGLTITKTANRTYSTCGSTLTYKITVTNKTGVDLENIKVLDLLDDTLVYHSSGNGFDPESGVWVISKLADGKSAELTLRAKIKKGLAIGTVVTNTAYLTEVTYDGEVVRMNPWLDAEASVTIVKGAPQTGDESDLGLWLAVMTASLALAGAAAVVFKKRRSN